MELMWTQLVKKFSARCEKGKQVSLFGKTSIAFRVHSASALVAATHKRHKNTRPVILGLFCCLGHTSVISLRMLNAIPIFFCSVVVQMYLRRLVSNDAAQH